MVSADKNIKTLMKMAYVTDRELTVTRLANKIRINEHSSTFRKLCQYLISEKALVLSNSYPKVVGMNYYNIDKSILMDIIQETEYYKEFEKYYNKIFLVMPFKKRKAQGTSQTEP